MSDKTTTIAGCAAAHVALTELHIRFPKSTPVKAVGAITWLALLYYEYTRLGLGLTVLTEIGALGYAMARTDFLTKWNAASAKPGAEALGTAPAAGATK